MLIVQLEEEETKPIVVASPLGAAVDATGVVHHEGRHGAEQRIGGVGGRFARRHRRPPDGTHQRRQHVAQSVAELVRTAA